MPSCGPVSSIEIKFDFSLIDFPGDFTPKPLWEKILKCVIVSLLILVAIVGNTLIIVIVSSSKKMRSTTNFYIVNLAVADLFVACFPMWIYITTDITNGWILGEFFCKFNAFVQTCSMTVIAFTMMAIAGDRFFAIVFPFKARVTQSKVKIVLAFVWLCAISISIPPLVFYKYFERRWKDYTETFCTDIWPDNNCDFGVKAERAYWTVVVAVLNWLPMLMMTINYSVIIHRLRFTRVVHGGSNSMTAIQKRSARRVVTMMFALLIAFMVCTIPFQVSTMYENYKDRQIKV
ncbi:neuropeptide ff receptor 2 [Plakobranchus ocellatus]|uniref:Neuropeptide ff receptor 2 n=1 Tax=Plakobranchus ocellatus TaxID=259542 RepID=A0AAV3Z9P5_9GAST|nr:neuropeptide ff receptor 2 [Plakobranchus ocellatus]